MDEHKINPTDIEGMERKACRKREDRLAVFTTQFGLTIE
jgi:hypothetical protein